MSQRRWIRKRETWLVLITVAALGWTGNGRNTADAREPSITSERWAAAGRLGVGAARVGVSQPLPAKAEPAASQDDGVVDDELRAKALRYHQALQRRPAPGFLFDRFYDAWLEFSTLADLEQFLSQQAANSQATADQVLLAFFYAKQSDDVKALAQFQLALADNPASAATWYEKAAVAARTLDFDSALQDLARAAELNRAATSPDKELGLSIAKQQASLLVRGGQIAAAMEAWEQLIAANPNDELLLEDIVEQQMAEGLLEQALATTERLLDLTKDPYQVVMRRMRQGDILQRAGKQPDALAVYGQTLPRVGRETWLERELIAQIAELFRRDDNLVGLKEYLEKLLAEEPDRLALHKAVARVSSQLGQADTAIATLRKIVDLTPGDRDNRENLIAALAQAQRTEDAVAQQQALITQFPADAELSIKLAELQQKRGDNDAARAALREYLTKANFSEAAYLRAARTLDGFGLPEDTRQLYQEALSRYPAAAVVREAFGGWLYQADDKAAALTLWQQMAEGADKQELLRVARMLGQRGEHAEVVRLLGARLGEFDTDTVYLGQLIDASLALKQDQETLPWLRRRTAVSASAADLENTMTQAVIVFRRLSMPPNMLETWRADAGLAEGAVTAPLTSAAVSAACVLAELLESQGESAAADQVLAETETRMAAMPELPQATELLATQRIRLWTARQDLTQAADAALRLVQAPGGRQSVHLRRLVELYMRDEQPEQALAWVEQWKQASPGSVLPWINESQLLARLNRSEDSLRVLRQASRRFPQDSDLAAMLAEKYAAAGQGREAERLYWRQFQQTEDSAEQLRWVEQLARLKVELGETDELVQVFRERQKSNPESVEPLLALALIYRQADNYEERRAVLMEASRKQPDNLALLLETARLEETSGDWQEALTTLERALPLDPSGQVAQRMAKICFDYGDATRGLQILAEMFNQPTVGPRDVESLVDAMIKADEWEGAKKLLLPQLTRWPDDWRLLYLQGVIDLRLGNVDAARETFLGLLTVDTPLPSIKSIGSSYSGPLPHLQRLPATVRLQGNLQYRADEPLAHEVREGYRGYYYAQSGNYVMLPEDPQVCQHYAFWQLIFLNRSHPHSAEDRLAILRKMGEAGMPDADLLYDLFLELNPESPYGGNLFNDAIFEKYSERVSVWQMYLLQSLDDDSSDVERLTTAFERFAQVDSTLGLLAALQIVLSNPEEIPASVQSQLPQLLDNLDTAGDASYMAFMGVAQLLRGGAMGEAMTELTQVDGVGEKLNQLLLQWYLSNDTATEPWERTMLQNALLKSMARSQSVDQIRQLLESELAAATMGTATVQGSSSPYTHFGGGNPYGPSDELFELLEFPPTSLPGVPWILTKLPAMMSNLEPWQYDESTGELDEETAALLGQVAQQTEQPLLKAMLEVFLGRDLELQGEDPTTAYTTLQATLEQWLEAEPNRVEALLLSAGLATHQQRWSDAATWLERTARQPLPADQRRRLDSAAVALALKGQVVALDEPEQASLVAVARSAALRLRRHALNGDQRLELLQALEVLDLTEEAGQMQSRLAQSSGGAAGLGRVARSGRTTSPDRIFELLQNDKKDAAYRLLSQDLQALARTRLAGKFALVDDDDYELRQFQRMVNQLQVSSELLQHVMTEMSDRVDMLGFVQELFGDREQAVEYYRQFVEANPGRDAVQLRGLLLQLSSPNFELAEGLAMLDTLDSKSLPTFGLQILSKLPTLPLTFEQRLQVVEYLLNRAEPEAEQDPNSVAWLTAAWPVLTAATSLDPEVSEESEPFGGRDQNRQSSSTQDLGAAMESMAARLSPLYVPTSDVELNEDELGNEKLRAVYQRIQQAKITRTAMQERVCQLLLTAPQTASEAFSHWLAVREAQRQVDSAAAVEQATSVLRLVATASASGRGSSNAGVSAQQRAMRQMMQQMQRGGMPSPYGQNEESTWRTVPLRTPAQFLTRQLGESPSAENAALIAELSEGLRAQRKVELANELQRRYELQAATAEDFGGVVSRLMSEGKQRRNNTAENPNQLIMEVYTERELKVDLLPSLLTQIRADREENQWNRLTSNQELLAGYLTRHVEIQGASAIAPSIRELSLAWLGDEATQTRLIERFGGKENLPAGRGEAAPYATYVTFLTSLANGSPRLAFAGLTELERLQATQQVSLEYVGYAVSQAIGEERDAAVILAIFDSSPFFNGLETFQPYPLSNGNGESVYGTLLNRLRYSEFRTRRSVVRKLKEREPTFGLRVFLESFEKTGRWEKLSVKEVHEALKPELEQLAALTDERLKVVVDFIKEVTEGSDNSTNQGDPEVLAVLSRGVEILSPLQRLMDAKSIANLGIQPYPYAIQEYASGVLLPLLKEHPDDFLAGMKHLLKLAAPVYRRQGDNVSELVSRLLTGAVSLDPPRGLAVSLRYASETNSEGFDLFEFLEDSLVRDLSRALQVALIAVHSERNSDQLQVFSQDLSQALEDADVSVLHFPFTRLLDSLSLSADNRTAIAKWAQQAQQDDKLAAIAQQWWLATQLANLAVVDSSTPNVDQASVRQILLEQVRDPNRAVPFRFVSALSLLSWKLLGDQPDDFALCLDVISENLSRSKQVTTAPQWLMTVLTRLEAIPDDAELQAVGGKFMTLWERYAGQATRGYFGRPALLPSIRLYHRLQKPSGVQAVVRGLGELEPGPDVIGELTRLGYANLAWSQLNRRWSRIETPELDLAAAPRPIADANEASRMVWFDATLEAKLPDLLALANHPGTKYLTELYLSQLLDPPATQSQPSVARRQRLERLAASFGEQTFANTDEQKLAVAMLVQLESPPDAVLTGLRTLVDKLSPTDIWSRRLEEVSSRRNRDLLTQQIVVELRAGQRESLAKLLAQVDAMPADDWETRQALSQLLERLSANLMRGLAGLDAETLVAVAPDLLKLEAKDEFNRSSRLRILLQIWFHVQGRSPEFTGLLAAVDGGSGAAARFLGGARTSSTGPNIDEVWPLVKRMKADAGETPLEERVKLVKGIWELTKTGATVGSGHFREGVKESCDSCRVARMGLDAIEDAGLLSNEELITIGPELARIDAVGGEIWRQIGQRQMAAEQWEAAASSLKRAVSATGRTMAQARANRQLEYAWALHQAGDNEEAKKLVPKVTAELLMGDNPQRLEQLKKLIE